MFLTLGRGQEGGSEMPREGLNCIVGFEAGGRDTGQGFQVAPGSWEWLWQGQGRGLSCKEGTGPPGFRGGAQPDEPLSGF